MTESEGQPLFWQYCMMKGLLCYWMPLAQFMGDTGAVCVRYDLARDDQAPRLGYPKCSCGHSQRIERWHPHHYPELVHHTVQNLGHSYKRNGQSQGSALCLISNNDASCLHSKQQVSPKKTSCPVIVAAHVCKWPQRKPWPWGKKESPAFTCHICHIYRSTYA